MKRVTLALTLALAAPASAQTVSLTLPDAVARALTSGPDVSTARANLQKAQATLRATRADPTTIVTTLTQAEQGAAAAEATLAGTKLNVAQTVIGQYLAASEAAGRVSLNEAQVRLDERTLQIARARLTARVATQLDVNRAQTTLNQDRQELADARASLPVLEAQLVRTLGLNTGADLRLATPPAPPRLSATLSGLQTGLEKRLPTLVQAAQGAEFAALQVRVSNNDYTPARTLQDAQVALENARRDLEGAQRGANTQVRDAYRSAQDAVQRVELARQTLANAQTTLTQAQARLRAGTAAAVDVQSAQVQAQQAQFGVTQAQGNLWRSLAALSAASGTDVTGLVR
ncbi:TolC family protein [Deinococcus sp. YIM 134068]|uniref:TolC family protein n=1 Tax=Deinococcus lichenicola TaxID=3118910 RepID=UPI002F9505D7